MRIYFFVPNFFEHINYRFLFIIFNIKKQVYPYLKLYLKHKLNQILTRNLIT